MFFLDSRDQSLPFISFLIRLFELIWAWNYGGGFSKKKTSFLIFQMKIFICCSSFFFFFDFSLINWFHWFRFKEINEMAERNQKKKRRRRNPLLQMLTSTCRTDKTKMASVARLKWRQALSERWWRWWNVTKWSPIKLGIETNLIKFALTKRIQTPNTEQLNGVRFSIGKMSTTWVYCLHWHQFALKCPLTSDL